MESGEDILLDKVTAPEAKRFGPSERALKQRRWLILGVKALALTCLLVILFNFQPPRGWAGLLKWAGAAFLVWAVWRMPGKALLEPMQQRSLTLHEHAIELNRGGFRRFIVFESLRHIQLLQGSNERLVALVLHTADDSVVIRDFEGLGEVFAALSVSKPPSVLIEVEARSIDWGEPLPWAVAFGCFAVVGCLLI